ncbi:MAG TPA: archaemetzincin family Zn-dependent metalloprotease [Methanobacteriales archaeon]|nr:MAG: Peptidase zinc-dependent [Methanobacteriaceae archaeon 41_258]MBC7089264.1 archaemetzincin family Zn-dependent metalloprotease [Methanobacteriaceae archaeon]MBC7096983.1 archaemetzincin family Zn-dependent metalloprotease [Methanobacteriales archaeon]HIH61383.1 archaemetzincin family Zn-dependent metalloprotease [Methanobacteriales archaeon]
MITIQPIGNVEEKILELLKKFISSIFNTKCIVSNQNLKVPENAYNPLRNQYHSTKLLLFLKNRMKAEFTRSRRESPLFQEEDVTRVLGVTDVDLYAPHLNFVFGEAESPGKFAIISTYRLRHLNKRIFIERVLKEAIHELGHTFGLAHCSNPFCVMYFSNSITDTDKKSYMFCNMCLKKLKLA